MRLAVISDAHGNLPALDAVLLDLDRRGGADFLVDLGDRVSGPLWPAETAARFEERGIAGVRGNHDREAGAAVRQGLGRTDAFAWDRLTAAQRAALAALPASLDLAAWGAPGVVAFHARPDRDDAYLIDRARGGRQVRRRPEAIAQSLGAHAGERLILTGHSHRADLLRLPGGRHVGLHAGVPGGATILNPGSVGLPAADADDHAIEAGTPDARYAIVDTATLAVALLAVPYDHEAAARQAEANGRDDWASWLRTGWAR